MTLETFFYDFDSPLFTSQAMYAYIGQMFNDSTLVSYKEARAFFDVMHEHECYTLLLYVQSYFKEPRTIAPNMRKRWYVLFLKYEKMLQSEGMVSQYFAP